MLRQQVIADEVEYADAGNNGRREVSPSEDIRKARSGGGGGGGGGGGYTAGSMSRAYRANLKQALRGIQVSSLRRRENFATAAIHF